MKKTLPFLILFILALLIWDAMFSFHDYAFVIGDEDFDGPLGAIAGMLLAGGGLIIGLIVTVFVGVILALVFAGVGVVVLAALAMAAVCAIIVIAPLLLPLLIPIGIIWFLATRNSRRQAAVPPMKESVA